MALFPVLYPRRLVDEETGRPYLGLHVCELECYGLVLGYGLAEGGSFCSVMRGVAEGGLGDADGLGGNPDPTTIQGAARDAKPFPLFPEPILFRDEDVI